MMSSSRRLSRSLFALVAVLALFATACGGTSADVVTEAAVDTSSGTAAPAADEPAQDTAAAPASSTIASTVDGAQIDFGSLAGQDVVLWFWAPW